LSPDASNNPPMTIYKCDLCQIGIADKKDRVYVSQWYIVRGHYLCGKPVLDFMAQHQFLEN